MLWKKSCCCSTRICEDCWSAKDIYKLSIYLLSMISLVELVKVDAMLLCSSLPFSHLFCVYVPEQRTSCLPDFMVSDCRYSDICDTVVKYSQAAQSNGCSGDKTTINQSTDQYEISSHFRHSVSRQKN